MAEDELGRGVFDGPAVEVVLIGTALLVDDEGGQEEEDEEEGQE